MEPMESRVFVLQRQKRYDISAVEYYSKELVYVLNDEHINPFDTNGFVELIKHRLIMEHFDPNKDFICLTGSSVLLSLFMAIVIWYTNGYSNIKVLMFDAKTTKYKLRILNFGG